MTFSFSKFFGLKKREHSSLLVHDDRLEIAQFRNEGEAPELLGLNRIELKPGVLERGMILKESDFQVALQKLISGAQPSPIESHHLYINVPFLQLHPFMKSFSKHAKEEYMQSALQDLVKSKSPIPLEELELEYALSTHANRINYGAIAYPKKWVNAVREACTEIGIHDLHFFPEPLAQLGLSQAYIRGNFALFSWQAGQVYLSLFHDDLLYDCFPFKTQLAADGSTDSKLMQEYQKASRHFEDLFKKPIQSFYLVGFPPEVRSRLSALLNEKKFEFCILQKEDTPLKDAILQQGYSATLYGIAMRALKHE